MPVIPPATRSQHVDFAYDQVVRPHRSYRPSGGLPRGKPRTRHMWICLQLSGARGVDNGGVKDDWHIYGDRFNLFKWIYVLLAIVKSWNVFYEMRNIFIYPSCCLCNTTTILVCVGHYFVCLYFIFVGISSYNHLKYKFFCVYEGSLLNWSIL